jgi:uncharacterized membrane protein (UPF0127 family)
MSGFPGSIIDVYKAYDQGVDLIGQYEQQMAQQQQPQVAQTPQERQEGLRPAHQSGDTNQSMVFPNTEPNASFNTVGMKAPIDIKQYDNTGNLVASYDKVPPGVTDLKMSSQGGTVLETPAQMQGGGFKPAPRMGVRQNPDKSVSTHKYATETLDGENWFSFPTLFQNPDSSWVDMSEGDDWFPAYEEALRRGEVLNFGEDKKGALEWGMGSWKDSMQNGGSTAAPGVSSWNNAYPVYNNMPLVNLPEAEVLGSRMGWEDNRPWYYSDNTHAWEAKRPFELQQAKEAYMTGVPETIGHSIIPVDSPVDYAIGFGPSALKGLTKGALKNIYKLNPFANKLTDPNAYYRIAGRDALEDAMSSGVVRSKTIIPEGADLFALTKARPTSFPSYAKGTPDLTYLKNADDVIFKNSGPMYKRGDILPNGNVLTGRHWAYRPYNESTKQIAKSIPVEEIYKATPHWLMGHKKIYGKRNGGVRKYQEAGEKLKPFNWNEGSSLPSESTNQLNFGEQQFSNQLDTVPREERILERNPTISQGNFEVDDNNMIVEDRPSYLEMAANPMATARAILDPSVEGLPSSIEWNQSVNRGNTLGVMANDVFNPAAWANYGVNAARDLSEGNYMSAGINALNAIPGVSLSGNAIIGQGIRNIGYNVVSPYLYRPRILKPKEIIQNVLDPMGRPLREAKAASWDTPAQRNVDKYARRLDAFALGLGKKPRYGTLEQIGDNVYEPVNGLINPQGFSNQVLSALNKRLSEVGSLGERGSTIGVFDNTFHFMGGYHLTDKAIPGSTMRNITMNDRWDLQPFQGPEGVKETLGHFGLGKAWDALPTRLQNTLGRKLQDVEVLETLGGKPIDIQSRWTADFSPGWETPEGMANMKVTNTATGTSFTPDLEESIFTPPAEKFIMELNPNFTRRYATSPGFKNGGVAAGTGIGLLGDDMQLPPKTYNRYGGVRKAQKGLPPFDWGGNQTMPSESTNQVNFGEQAFLNQLNTAPKEERVLERTPTTSQENIVEDRPSFLEMAENSMNAGLNAVIPVGSPALWLGSKIASESGQLMRNVAYNLVSPYTYRPRFIEPSEIVQNIIDPMGRPFREATAFHKGYPVQPETVDMFARRLDALALGLGKTPRYGTLQKIEDNLYEPTVGLIRPQHFLDNFQRALDRRQSNLGHLGKHGSTIGVTDATFDLMGRYHLTDDSIPGSTMREITMNDTWDLHPFTSSFAVQELADDLGVGKIWSSLPPNLQNKISSKIENVEVLEALGGKPINIQSRWVADFPPEWYEDFRNMRIENIATGKSFWPGRNRGTIELDPNFQRNYKYGGVRKYQEGGENDENSPKEISWYTTPNFKNWGLLEYPSTTTFNSAFKDARQKGEEEFVWNSNRYHTELAPEEASNAYNQSKDFINRYIENAPFTWEPGYYETSELSNRHSIEDLVELERNPELRQTLKDSIIQSEENLYRDQLRQNLEQPFYFSLTSENSPTADAHGFVNWRGKQHLDEPQIFISYDPNNPRVHSTSVHELAHKTLHNPEGTYVRIPTDLIPETKDRKWPAYLANNSNYYFNPKEIEARAVSALYYLDQQGVDVFNEKVTEEDLFTLQSNKESNLPNDVYQLLDIYQYDTEKLIRLLNRERDFKSWRPTNLNPRKNDGSW